MWWLNSSWSAKEVCSILPRVVKRETRGKRKKKRRPKSVVMVVFCTAVCSLLPGRSF
jgi:hypothetical protein